MLNCWTGLWHPALLNMAGAIPLIQSIHSSEAVWDAEQLGDDLRPILTVPAVGAEPLCSEMLMSWSADCEPMLVEQPVDRESIFQLAIESASALGDCAATISDETVADFYALGYAYLQIQLMTRKLRFSSNLNEADFLSALLEAAKAAVAGDDAQSHEKLLACFDLLLEEKNCYYPVEPRLCELLLLHKNTLGKSLENQLAYSDDPISILMTGALARKLEETNPQASIKIKDRLEQKDVCLLGGLESELADQLVSSESWVNQLNVGRSAYNNIFGQPPNVFARRRFGLNPTTPNILQKFGYAGAVHANFSAGQIPDMGNGIMRWSGDDDEAILAVSEKPMDAADNGTFLRLSIRLGEMIDSVHAATALLAHWPGKTCVGFEDLKRVSRFVPLLGSFETLDQLFEDAYDPGYGQSFSADEYRSPYLTEALAASAVNPISRYTSYWQRHCKLEAVRRVLLMATCANDLRLQDTALLQQQIDKTQNEIEFATQPNSGSNSHKLDERLQGLLEDVKNLFQPQPIDQCSACLVLNCQSSKKRIEFTPEQSGERLAGTMRDLGSVVVAANSSKKSTWVLDLPPFGETPIDWNQVDAADCFKRDPKLVDGLEMQNEFFRVLIDSKSGGIKSVRKHLSRDNLVGQQLSIRLPANHSAKQRYAKMVADDIQTIEESALTVAIRSEGRIVAGGEKLAAFSQTVRICRSINRIEVSGKINLCEPLLGSSRQHYVCSRLAWKSEAARLYSNLLESQMQVTQEWFHGTQYVTIKDDSSVSLLTGGLPYHRRASRRMLDSVLMIGKETKNEYSFAIDLDQDYPAAAATARLTPKIQIPIASADNRIQQCYFHFSRKNVLVTYARPLFDAEGKHYGVAFRLKETESRAADLSIRCFRKLESAEIVGFNGELISSIDVSPDDSHKVQFRIERLSYFETRLYFKS